MVEFHVAVPTVDELSVEFSVEVNQPEYPDGSVHEQDITAVLGGWPDNPNDEILGFVFPDEDDRVSRSTSGQSAEVYPELKRSIQGAMMSHMIE